jgi:hypothetical protein
VQKSASYVAQQINLPVEILCAKQCNQVAVAAVEQQVDGTHALLLGYFTQNLLKTI